MRWSRPISIALRAQRIDEGGGRCPALLSAPAAIRSSDQFSGSAHTRRVIDGAAGVPFGLTPQDFKLADSRMLTSVVCVDPVIQAPIQSQTEYLHDQIAWNRRFARSYSEDSVGRYTVDYSKFHTRKSSPLSIVGVEPPPEPPVELLRAVDIRDGDDDHLELRLDSCDAGRVVTTEFVRAYGCLLGCGTKLYHDIYC